MRAERFWMPRTSTVVEDQCRGEWRCAARRVAGRGRCTCRSPLAIGSVSDARGVFGMWRGGGSIRSAAARFTKAALDRGSSGLTPVSGLGPKPAGRGHPRAVSARPLPGWWLRWDLTRDCNGRARCRVQALGGGILRPTTAAQGRPARARQSRRTGGSIASVGDTAYPLAAWCAAPTPRAMPARSRSVCSCRRAGPPGSGWVLAARGLLCRRRRRRPAAQVLSAVQPMV